MPNKTTRGLYLLASTSILTLGLVATSVTVNFDLDQPVLKVAQAESSCFTGDTRILMADGSEKPIRQVRVGDLIMGPGGRANRVIEVERPVLGERLLYSINGGPHFVTAEHPLMTATGWKAIDPAATAAESPDLVVGALALGDCLTTLRPAGAPSTAGNLALAGLVLEKTVLRGLDARAADPQTPLFNLLLDGDHAYFADGYLVHNKGGDGGGGSGGGGGEGGSGSSGSGGGGEGGEGGSGGSGSGGSGDGSGSGDGGGSGGGGEGGEGGSGSGDGSGGEGGEGGSGSGDGSGGEGGEGGSSGASGSGEGGESGDDGAEAGEAGDDGAETGEAGEADSSGPSSASASAFGGLDQVGPDLSQDQEADAISKGWQ